MTLPQIEALAIVAGMLILFVSDRLRYDLVAALALSAAVLTGVVPAHKAFQGFANPVIIIIASVLVISRAVAVSGVIDNAMRRVLRALDSTTLQVAALTGAVSLLSAFVKNVGALGLFMPIAIQAAERRNRPPSRYLMPLAFGSLIGGTITQIGTSPNVLISAVRQEVLGQPYHLFDFTPVGLPLTCIAVAFLSFGWRLLPANRRGQPTPEQRFSIEDYTSEALLPEGSPLLGKTVADLEALGEGEVTVTGVIREQTHRYVPRPNWTLYAGDVLVLQGDPTALQPIVDQAKLKLLGADEIAALKPEDKDDVLETVEAVVAPDSLLIGNTPQDLHLRQNYEVNLLALSRAEERTTTRLRSSRFAPNDILVLQGRQRQLARALTELGLLPLAERNLAIGRPRWRWLPLLILLAAMLAIAVGAVEVEVGFFVAATLIVLLRLTTPREAYDAVEWPIIVMLGCLIPVGEALKDTGAANLMADGLTVVAAQLPAYFAVGLIMVVSMLVTPLLHHAAAVLLMGPVAAAVAKNLGLGPDAFLMAVAFGAASDFLTPIGHQNSTLVMGPGGYRFSDYWRLGLPLTIIVAVCGTALILWQWPLR
ncbi:MAG TPA: SLC13 family permease [Acetobacteraceae bacterium]